MFFFSCLSLRAPGFDCLVIARTEPLNYYDKLIKAVVMVETNNGKCLYNEFEGAVGYFQIRQVRVDDYNRLRGTKYALNDFYDYELSRKVFLYFTRGRSYREVAKTWNGSGELTEVYWKKVKILL